MKRIINVFIILIILIELTAACNYISPSECPKIDDNRICNCARKGENNTLVICCNIISDFLFKESLNCVGLLTNITEHVHIYNVTLDTLDATIPEWQNLNSITLTNSSVKRIKGNFNGNLKCLNLSSNTFIKIETNAFVNLIDLTELDLSNNNLTKLPELPLNYENNLTLDISNNLNLECHNVMDIIGNQTNLKFTNRNSTFCLTSQSFDWFSSTFLVSLEQVERLQGLDEECPKGLNYFCKCQPYRAELIAGKPTIFSVKVNCSGQNLEQLPPNLPPNTKLLDVSNNNITSLDPLITDTSYSDVREFLADNNRISSITSLEQSQFIDNFDRLTITRNELKSIPIYILSNTFDRNWDGRFVKLGGNKLNCDCNTAQVLKLWLLANKGHIPDYEDVLCEKDLEKVINLDQNKVCVYQKDWTDYIYYIIAAEIILLSLLISKVSYDYWVFKTSGYLPWPASQMPKLPCDWVFET